MYTDIIMVMKVITVFQILMVSMFLLLHAQRKSKKNIMLVLFIMAKAFFVGDTLLLTFQNNLPAAALYFACLGPAFQFLLGPAIYFVMMVTTNNTFSFKPKHLIHIVPFLLYFVYIISQYQLQPSDVRVELLKNWFPYLTSWSRTVYLLNFTQFTLYGIIALKVLSNAKEYMYRFNSQPVGRNIFYLKFIIYDFIVFWSINVVSIFVPFGETGGMILEAATVFNIFFIANAIVYQGLKFPYLFRDAIEDRPKYEKNALSEREKEQYAKKINSFVSVQKPYLNPMLSLSDLAAQLAIPSYTLSQILNVVFNQNFYDFINRYRIEESKALLSIGSNNEITILEVSLKCGFNSKSAFNSAFKKYTNMTPREFKKTAVSAPPSAPKQ